jgi:hypothetical protein
METNKNFDCLEMKSNIQKNIYTEIKGMSAKELLFYFNGNKSTGKTAVKKSKKIVRV